ncbi:hypothetical protein CX042_11710 [Bordetella pertussis]|nr:hypothetical protein AL474_02315 [Bordetella pertussis]PNP05022.1 hypothetical protein AL465_015585 [Bordetella pertussis 18323]ANS94131.1 hypothetical protein A8B95_12875 [Bordetella pertussis]ANS97131.1 hypothetical protein A8B96_08890 [Bordetella pertussis]ANT01127.1 hypothetical protein A8B94_11170 [Bordetella pertussis]
MIRGSGFASGTTRTAKGANYSTTINPLLAEFLYPSCEDSIGCMHGSSEPDLRNWKSPTPQFTQGARPDEHP